MTTQRKPSTVEELTQLVGQQLGPTAWRLVSQQTIDAFAAVTGDDQWIHIDAARATGSAIGSTIAHGLFTLSLGPVLTYELLETSAFAHGLNYGYNRVRFPSPLPVGSRIRMRMTITDVLGVPGGINVISHQVYEREGSDKPVCVADTVARYVP